MIKAAIFDMDGLLIDSEPFWQKAQLKAFKSVDIELSKADLHHTMGRGVASVVEYRYHQKPWTGKSLKDVEAMIVDDLLEQVRQEGKLKPGVHQVFEIFQSRNIPMALASSSYYEIINTVIDKLEIREFFDVIYSAEHEEHSKPHPGVFISTAQRLGVMPEFCVVFEDAPSGVLAAKAAKMHCVAVPEPEVKSHKFIQTADLIIDSLEEYNVAMLKGL